MKILLILISLSLSLFSDFTYSQSYFASGSTGDIKIWDWESGRNVLTLPNEVEVISLKYIGDSILASGLVNGQIILWKLGISSAIIKDLIGHSDQVLALKLSNNKIQLASCSLDRKIILWDLKSLSISRTIESSGSYSIEYISDTLLASAEKSLDQIHIWDLMTGNKKIELSHSAVIDLLLIDNEYLLSSANQNILKWSLSNFTSIEIFEEVGGNNLRKSDSNNIIFIGGDGKANKLNIAIKNREILSITSSFSLDIINYIVLIGTNEKKIEILKDSQLIREIDAHSSKINAIEKLSNYMNTVSKPTDTLAQADVIDIDSENIRDDNNLDVQYEDSSLIESITSLIIESTTKSILLNQIDETITTEPTTETTVIPESSTVTTIIPESSTVTALVTESSSETTVIPESTTETTVIPESTTETTVIPESTTETTLVTESTTETTVIPESTTETTVILESSTVTTLVTESTTETTVIPESTTETTVIPESSTVTTLVTESTTVTTLMSTPTSKSALITTLLSESYTETTSTLPKTSITITTLISELNAETTSTSAFTANLFTESSLAIPLINESSLETETKLISTSTSIFISELNTSSIFPDSTTTDTVPLLSTIDNNPFSAEIISISSVFASVSNISLTELIDNLQNKSFSFDLKPDSSLPTSLLTSSKYDIADCVSNCSNQGICKVNGLKFNCECDLDFTGLKCEKDLRPCSYSQCLNYLKCENIQNGTRFNQDTQQSENYYYDFQCICKEKYYGKRCENKINPCQNETCSGNGICKVVDNGGLNETIKCECFGLNAFEGEKCEKKSASMVARESSIRTTYYIAISAIFALFLFVISLDIHKYLVKKPKIVKKKKPLVKKQKLNYVP